MSITTPSRTILTIACYSLIVTGAFDALDTLAKLIASNINPGHLQVSLTEYPVGWRMQITSDDNFYPDQAHDLVEQRIREGVPVEIANGQNPMPTYLYPPQLDQERTCRDVEDCPF